MNELLMRHPAKYDDESHEGYVLRLSVLNFVPQKYFEINKLKEYSDEQDFLKYLTHLTRLTGHEYNQETILHHWFIKGFTIPGWKGFNYTRFCPSCLIESLYHRFHWSISICTYCYKHQLFLNENCDSCDKKIQIEDLVRGVCLNCSFSILESETKIAMFEKEPIVSHSHNINITNDSPYLNLILSREEYLRLIHWTSYCLALKILDLKLSSQDRIGFAHLGYLNDVIKQYEINKMAQDLLKGWPSVMVSFLNNHFITSPKKVKEFMDFLIHRIGHSQIKEILHETYIRENGFNLPNTDIEQINIDINYIPVIDVAKHFKLDYQTLNEYVVEFNVLLIKHPRNEMFCLHKFEIERISKLINISRNPAEKYISENEVAQLWNTDTKSIKIISEFFKIPTIDLLHEKHYHSKSVIKLMDKAKKLITVYELFDKTIWRIRTISAFMKSKSVSLVYCHNFYYGIYLRKDAMSVLDKSSTDLDFYMERCIVIDCLGKELFKASLLVPYYMNFGSGEKPYYLISDVEKVKVLYNEIRNMRDVESIRQREKYDF
jgi:hypothetical protein